MYEIFFISYHLQQENVNDVQDVVYMEIGSTMDKYFQKVYILRHCTLKVLY